MLPLLALQAEHAVPTDVKRGADGTEKTYEMLALHVKRAEDGDPSGMMRNVFTLAKHAIQHLKLDQHIAHYLSSATSTQTSTLQMMLASHYFNKENMEEGTASKDVHARGRLMWGANVAGGRRPAQRNPIAFSKAESLVKQAVALEKLSEAYTGERDGINYYVRFLDILSAEMKVFNDGAVEYLTAATDPQVKLNNPEWFAKYRALPPTDGKWM
jgi:hypothetical protein